MRHVRHRIDRQVMEILGHVQIEIQMSRKSAICKDIMQGKYGENQIVTSLTQRDVAFLPGRIR